MATLKIFPPDESERLVDLLDERVSLGRVVDNQIPVEDPSISSHHAEFILQGDSYLLKDLGSTNGTFVNGETITEVLLKPGDELRFGSVPAVFSPGVETSNVPLPDSTSSTAAEVGSVSSRPADFVNTSPFPKAESHKDVLLQASYGVAALAFIAFLVAVYAILNLLQVSSFPPV